MKQRRAGLQFKFSKERRVDGVNRLLIPKHQDSYEAILAICEHGGFDALDLPVKFIADNIRVLDWSRSRIGREKLYGQLKWVRV